MGINLAKDLITNNHINPEQKLWRHVVIHAFEDAKIEVSDRKSSMYKWNAHQWFVEKSNQFQVVCYWSGWDPDEVQFRYQKGLKDAQIQFNERQLSWVKYTRLFNQYRNATDKESRKYYLKQVESARQTVFHATTALVTSMLVQSLSYV